MLDATAIKVIAFDVFNTVVDFSGVPAEERHAYADHIREPVWSPLTLPTTWERLPAFPDSAEGLQRLGEKFVTATCSNGPVDMLRRLAKNAGFEFRAYIPLSVSRAFKPQPQAYMTVCEMLGVKAKSVLMVTANADFGDVEAARRLGMQAVLIRGEEAPHTIIELAELLGC